MRYRQALPVLALLLITGCGRLLTAAPQPVDVHRIEKITLYADGGEEVIQPDDRRFAGLAKQLLTTLTSFNLPAGCVFSDDEILVMKQRDRLVELSFRGLERATIGELIPKEDREKIPTDQRGFRVLEIRTALFALSGEYQGHVFLPSKGKPSTWGCWAIEKGKEIDIRWIEKVEEALEGSI